MNYYFLFFQDQLLLTADGTVPQGSEPPVALESGQRLQPLPPLPEAACFAAQLAAPPTQGEWQMVALRSCFELLPAPLYQLAGKARELLHWDETT